MSPVESYRDLEIWQMGMDVARSVYRVTSKLPKSETYGLVSQMRRAAVSIPSNIAEGYVRRSRKELKRFLAIAHGSLAELETQTLLARDFEYLSSLDHDDVMELLDHLGRKVTLFSRRIDETWE